MLTLIGGPMFSGKTTWLLDHVKELPSGSFQLFKPNIDVRYGDDELVTHNGERLPARNLSTKKPIFPKLGPEIKTLLIDELNFFQAETLLPALREQEAAGRQIVAAGLLYDFMKQPFGATLPLSKVADHFEQLFARCDRCGKPAEHSYRKTQETDQVVLGAKDKYGACCSECWTVLSAGNT